MLPLQNHWLRYSWVLDMMQTLKKVFPYLLIAILSYSVYQRNQQLNQQISALQTKLAIQQSSIAQLQKRSLQVLQITKRYRTDISTLEDKYRYVRGSLESTLQNAKGVNRIVQQSVIDQLCSAYNGKYCIDGIYSNRANSTLQNTSSKR